MSIPEPTTLAPSIDDPTEGDADGRGPRAALAMRGGVLGAMAPFAVFLAGAAWLGLSGTPDERGFWPVLIVALAVSRMLATDASGWAEAVIDGMSDRLVALMIVAWMLAGILSVLLSHAGLVQGLVWLASQVGVRGGAYAAAAFAACALVSTSTGTSFGTILIAGPLLYPAGAGLGTDAVVLAGAILGGATFGDSISPLSDTTIASAGTQQADVAGTVRSRLRYVLPAAAAAVAAALTLGAAEPGTPAPTAVGDPHGLAMLVVPAIVLVLLWRRRPLVEALLAGVAIATVTGLLTGLIAARSLLRLDPEAFAARSLYIDGIERAVGVTVFTLLLVSLVGVLRRAGVVEHVVRVASDRARSVRGAEAWIVGAASAAVLVTTHSVVAILAVGDVARALGRRHGIGAYRRANLLDTTVCTWPFLLPYFLPTILMAGATAGGPAIGFPRLTPLEAGVANVFSWALLAVIAATVARGGKQGGG